MFGACLKEESVLAGGTNLQMVDRIPQEICPPTLIKYPEEGSYSPQNLFLLINYPRKFGPSLWSHSNREFIPGSHVRCPVTDLMHVHHGPDKGPDRGQDKDQNG